MKTYQLFINGDYVDPANGKWFDSIDPYRGGPWARIPRGSAADADRAVKAANAAMWHGPWSKMTASARGKAMHKLGDLVAANAERLAEIGGARQWQADGRDAGPAALPSGMVVIFRRPRRQARRRPGADRQGGHLCLHHA